VFPSRSFRRRAWRGYSVGRSDGDAIDDPGAYTKPWTVTVSKQLLVDTELEEYCAKTTPPSHPAHAAALGITFYDANQFPQRYRNGGFVALHGSWNRSVAAGYKVVFFPMVNGRPGPIEDFVSNMLVRNGEDGGAIEAWGRPVGVTVARDGSLLVSDDGSNVIWKVGVRK
jgi:glucose/arabinose dehydrogenase